MNFEHPIEWNDEKISRLWNYYSKTPPYSEIYFSKVFGDKILKASGLPLNEEIQVLDFGCGPGFIWEHMQKLGARWHYTGLDFSPDSLKKVEEKIQGSSYFQGTYHATSLPTTLPELNFDAILLFEVVEHLNDAYLDATLIEASRLLKYHGVLIITTPNDEDLSKSTKFCPDCGSIFHEWQHLRSWSAAALQEKIQQYGFNTVWIKTVNFSQQGFLSRVKQVAQQLLRGKKTQPHMIAAFQKIKN